MRRLALALALVLLAAAAGGCGLPEDDRPRLVAAEDAPADLSPSTATSEVPSGAGEETVEVFFLDVAAAPARLQPVERAVTEVDVRSAIEMLLQGLSEEERDDGVLSDDIPEGVVLLDWNLAPDGLLTLNLGQEGEGGIQSVGGDAQAHAFAQLVYTATSLPDVTSVSFLVDGQPIKPLADLGEADGPVTRDDYASVDPDAG